MLRTRNGYYREISTSNGTRRLYSRNITGAWLVLTGSSNQIRIEQEIREAKAESREEN